MKPSNSAPIIDSRHLKILAAKKDQLKDAVAVIFLDEEKYGHYNVSELRQIAEQIESFEPSGKYLLSLKNIKMNIYAEDEIKNRDIIVSIEHPNGISEQEIEQQISQAFGAARSVKFVHHYVKEITT